MRDAQIVNALVSAGFDVHPARSSVLAIQLGGETLHASVKRVGDGRPPTPSEMSRLQPDDPSIALFSVRKLSSRARTIMSEYDSIGFIADDGQMLLPAPLSTALPDDPPTPRRLPRGRVPWTRYALMRVLLRTSRPRQQRQLADEVAASQASVSQNLSLLGALVEQSPAGWRSAAPGALIDAFLSAYPGPLGTRTYWFSTDPVITQASRLPDAARLSGDAASDALAPWRSPVRAVGYTAEPVDLARSGFSATTSDAATLELVMPEDDTVFRTAEAWGNPGLVDPLIAAWDLSRIGGPSAADSVARLRRRILAVFE